MDAKDTSILDVGQFLREFQDHLVPKLDTYEQVIYLYVFRRGRLEGNLDVVIGFKSSRRKMGFGIGEKGKPMSEGTCYEKLKSLQVKGCLEVVSSDRDGTKVRLKLPSEIPNLIPVKTEPSVLNLEELDFFEMPEYRAAILRRETNLCFYCLRSIDSSNYVIEHIESRPEGNNTYLNVVAACRSCNNRKGSMTAESFLRSLHRSGFLSPEEFELRISALSLLKSGELRPVI
jgi:hypothetical protein